MTDSVISFGFEPNREDSITPRDVDWSTSNYRRHAPFLCPAIRAKAIFRICAKNTAAPGRVACRPAQAKICETAAIRTTAIK